jgi:hypothetical protein
MQHLSPQNAESRSASDPAGLHRQPSGCADVGSVAKETLRREDQPRLCRYASIVFCRAVLNTTWPTDLLNSSAW